MASIKNKQTTREYKPYTKSEYLNKLIESSKDGTFPSANIGTCKYRKDSTNNCKQKCAIGLLIPDELYNKNIEGTALKVIISEYALISPVDLFEKDAKKIQSCHDHFGFTNYINWNHNIFCTRLKELDYFSDSVSQAILAKELTVVQ